jgi:hypothetical protein
MTAGLNYQVRVIEEYQAPYPDPIRVHKGDEVMVDEHKRTDIAGWIWCTSRAGKSGWVPRAYIDLQGSAGKMQCDYSAVELTIQVGEILSVGKVESSFYWATNQSGQQGWVPMANVEQLKTS